MHKMIKDGVVRIVATEAEAERWKSLGYKTVESKTAASDSDPLASMGVDELKEYAKANGIDIGNATSQPGILKKIREAKPHEPKPEE